MAEIKIAVIIERLDWDMKRALEEAADRAVERKCNTWVTVPDHLVRP
jgi:hypothetical protein